MNLNILRLKQLFDSMQTPDTFEGSYQNVANVPQTNALMRPNIPSPVDDNGDIYALMNKMYQPEHAASDRFNSMIDQYPQRNEPGTMRKIAAAGLAGLVNYTGRGNPDMVHEDILYPGFRQKTQDWNARIKPAEDAATLERQTNVNERQMAYQTISAKLKEQADNDRAANNERKAQIAEFRSQVYAYKAQNPNMKFDFSGPTVLIADPATGKVTDTKIPTGSLSDMDKIAMQHTNTMAEIGARGANSVTLEGVRHGNDLTEIAARGTEARETKAVPTASQANKALSPTQQKTTRDINAQEVVTRYPMWSDYISIDDKGKFTGINTSGKSGKMKPLSIEDQNKLMDVIIGKLPISVYEGGKPETKAPSFNKTNVPIPDDLGRDRLLANRDMSKLNPEESAKTLFNRQGPTLPQSKGANVMSKTVRNKASGEIITVYSRDGGKTWSRD